MLDSFLEETSRNLAVANSLNDCQITASLFDNTCTSTTSQISFANVPSKQMSCTGQMRCPGSSDTSLKTYTTSSPCRYSRKLCVTCLTKNNETYIRVQTNALPNHCHTHKINIASAQQIDFTVKYNADVAGVLNYAANDVDSVEKVSELMCDISRTSSTNMLDSSSFADNTSSARML